MSILKIFLFCSLTIFGISASAQVKIRLYSDRSPESAVFSVTQGKYELVTYNGNTLIISKGEPVIISRFKGKQVVKTRNAEGLVCDSLKFIGMTGDDTFSLQVKPDGPARRFYADDLQCFPDLETLVLINICEIEKYISGVVKAEGGNGKNEEYFKTQAVIARTYMYKYFDKHKADRYNVCDNTHCQAFYGLSSDALINKAISETKDQVILTADSTLIMSAFHSNCGGETSSSEDVWLTSQPYLKRVSDPYCLYSGNARWEKRISLNDWLEYIQRAGYNGKTGDPQVFSFFQDTRITDYITGIFTMPLNTIRREWNLRSTFFTVVAENDSILLKGKGYGHGVGLCQEGAMAMAIKGFNYKQIIDFYYKGVFISDIKNAVFSFTDRFPGPPQEIGPQTAVREP
jgi:stage II sporulation protein D